MLTALNDIRLVESNLCNPIKSRRSKVEDGILEPFHYVFNAVRLKTFMSIPILGWNIFFFKIRL